MNDIILAILATVVAPAISGVVAYFVARRREISDVGKINAEQNGIKADTATKYRGLLNDEIERRRKAENQCDELEDACRELSDENAELREKVAYLKERLRKVGINPDTKPRGDL